MTRSSLPTRREGISDDAWPIGEVRTVAYHLNGEPLPEGASYGESPVITDHHRHYSAIVLLADEGGGIVMSAPANLADAIAREQIRDWQRRGVEIADALDILGHPDDVRTWGVVRRHIKAAWLAIQQQTMREAA
jgi:hypothetical protein